MNICVIYFSRTGNTKRLAQAIADTAKAPMYDLATVQPTTIQACDLLILGTPVEGASPPKETQAFVTNMPAGNGKKVILFCTYRVFGNERTMKSIEKILAGKGYATILKVSKKGMNPEEPTDFSKITVQVQETLEKLK